MYLPGGSDNLDNPAYQSEDYDDISGDSEYYFSDNRSSGKDKVAPIGVLMQITSHKEFKRWEIGCHCTGIGTPQTSECIHTVKRYYSIADIEIFTLQFCLSRDTL